MRVEQLEARDVPAILLTNTSTVTTAQGTAAPTVTVDDTAGNYHWNYHLHALAPASPPSSPGNPTQTNTAGQPGSGATSGSGSTGTTPTSINSFIGPAAPGSVLAGTLGSSVPWAVSVGNSMANNGIVQRTAGAATALILPGDSADFWFDTDPVDLVAGTTEFTSVGVVLPGVFLTQAPGAPAPVDYDAIYNKLIGLLLDRPPVIAAVLPPDTPASVLGPKWRTWAEQFNAEMRKIQDPRADLRLFRCSKTSLTTASGGRSMTRSGRWTGRQ